MMLMILRLVIIILTFLLIIILLQLAVINSSSYYCILQRLNLKKKTIKSFFFVSLLFLSQVFKSRLSPSTLCGGLFSSHLLIVICDFSIICFFLNFFVWEKNFKRRIYFEFWKLLFFYCFQIISFVSSILFSTFLTKILKEVDLLCHELVPHPHQMLNISPFAR